MTAVASKAKAKPRGKPRKAGPGAKAKPKITPARSVGRLSAKQLQAKALAYHARPRPGKISVVPTKPVSGVHDLSLAYSPGVAAPCLEIKRDAEAVYKYTNKGNLVGIISNGSAVLGLGDIGPLASKPVMEGKAMLFKLFADIDVFDIELDCTSPEKLIEAVTLMAGSFGAINLEDIAAPGCFQILERLTASLSIPVLHDDQSGTAVVTCSALRNALDIQKKKPENIKIVCVGAGAAGIGILRMMRSHFGIALEQIYLVDSKGLVTVDRPEMSIYKLPFAKPATMDPSLADVLHGADVFIGVSKKNILSKKMLLSMAPRPIILAMANPDPEILPEEVEAVRHDAIVATGRGDYPNQVNNSVCFPYLFRGALDARARKFTPKMFDAAIDAIADIACMKVPKELGKMYPKENMVYGPSYILPKQNDPRLREQISPRIAKAYDEKDI